ncbi:glycoside hydrolase family 19 protein [Duganella sp. FT109W]|uniref:Glycoside hydrolase family 19 protein n=1 Tax=Duganella margarita TaxID=2692170 RepID=A0ABW9WND7_9BURK|nr:glycoside hydrolase family 19 protein [Duganella margarita]MYN42749.1 glycoside hydrolase family 19 protein [Duganella margarita]
MPLAGQRRIAQFLAPLTVAMAEFEINTPARQASFLAQVGHESGQLQFVCELASGAAYDTGPLAARLGNTPQADGDGQRYKGRGLIQITGRTNYAACATALGLDLLSQPELLEQPVSACRSAGWFWKTHGLNKLADAGDQIAVTRRINGGTNGLAERLALFAVAKRVLS